ncbi:MAG: BCD family MFS transporter [Chloroflexota bacterium]|nr:BCD family MFS transporter [Chloroflexota bacterium]
METQTPESLSILRNIKIGLFHLGSGMTDIILNGVWNRIMISDLGFSATPISLLLALRYFLAPLGVWAGRMSDRRTLGGYRRLFWIWSGRLMMAVSIAVVGLTTASLVRGDSADMLDWAVFTLSLLFFSFGYATSGSTFLALIYDRTPEHQRGRAVGIVWTFLLLGFTLGGVLFSVLLPSASTEREPLTVVQSADGVTHSLPFTPETIQTLFVGAAIFLAVLWVVSLIGEEKRMKPGEVALTTGTADAESTSSLRADLRAAWSDRRTRYFFWFLGLSMMCAFSQDAILEPFAGEVFGMDARITTRFAAYWGSMAILGTLVFLFLSRRYKRLTNTVMNYIGVSLLLATFVLLAFAAVAGLRALVTPGLILLGLGLGIWNVGTLGLMMDMSPFGRAGTFLGFWTLVVTVARGLGVGSGGIIHDIGFALTGNEPLAYGFVFILGAVGLGASLWALRRVHVNDFKQDSNKRDTAAVFAGAMD